MAVDLLSALKEVFDGSAAAQAAVPGGWFTDDSAIAQTYPYVTVRQKSGHIELRSSTSNVDSVQIRIRVWGTNYEASKGAADTLENLFLSLDGLAWDGGWSTILERVDRLSPQPVGRVGGSAGGAVLRMIDLLFLAHVRRNVHA